MELPSPKPAAPPPACVASQESRLPVPERRGGKYHYWAAASFPAVTDASVSNDSHEAWLLPKCASLWRQPLPMRWRDVDSFAAAPPYPRPLPQLRS